MQQLIEQLKQAAGDYGVPMVLHTEHPDNTCAGFAHTVSHRRCTREVMALAYAVTGSPNQARFILGDPNPNPMLTSFNKTKVWAQKLQPVVEQLAAACHDTGAALYLYAQVTDRDAITILSHPPSSEVAMVFDTVRGRNDAIH
jgi:hypothetical protein